MTVFPAPAAQEKPEGSVFIMPLRLEECRVPEQLGRLHWVNLCERNGYRLLLKALQEKANDIERLQNASLLREMLVAPAPQPAYVVASPKYPSESSRIRGQAYDHRTFGDNLGVRGLIHSFGSILGVGEVELISAQHAPPNLTSRPLNLYLIGSRKVNPVTELMLPRVQRLREPKWKFGPPPGESEDGDWQVTLSRRWHRQDENFHGKTGRFPHARERINVLDNGVLIRVPHPAFPAQRIVLIAAGCRSLGTGAACLAAARPKIIREIKGMLPSGTLADKRSAFWVRVQGTISTIDTLLAGC